jgi:hypothetical protein
VLVQEPAQLGVFGSEALDLLVAHCVPIMALAGDERMFYTTGMCKATEDAADVGELDSFLAAAKRFYSAPFPRCDPSQMAVELRQMRHVADLIEIKFARRAGEFAATDEYDKQGYVSPIAWLRHECKTTGHVAATAISVGEQAEQLPLSVAATETGQIGFGHLGLLASTARALKESPTAGDFDEGRLLRKALAHSVSRFRHDCAHERHVADARAFLGEHLERVEARKFELLPCEDGAVVLRGFLDSVGGATLRTALEPLARRNGVADLRSREQRFADALVELANHGLDVGSLPTKSGQRPHLQITASLDTIRGLAGAPAGDLEFAAPVPATTVHRLGCDASVTRVVLDGESAVVDVGRARRLPGTAARRALLARDKGCVWPGCDRPASWTSAHHLRHWAHGGTTDLANLALVCHRHHWKLHEGGWQLVRSDESGDVVAVPPDPMGEPRARPPGAAAAA